MISSDVKITEAIPEFAPKSNRANTIPIIEKPAPKSKAKPNRFSSQLSGNKCSNTNYNSPLNASSLNY